MRRGLIALIAALAVMAVGASSANAFWNGLNDQRRGVSRADGASVPQGVTPTVVKTGSSTVRLTWPQSTLSNGAAAAYRVDRVNADTGEPFPATDGCLGRVTATTCTEAGVPQGRWSYHVTPLFGANWQGQPSVGAVSVNTGPGTLTLGPTRVGGTVLPLPVTLTGTLTGFGPNERIDRYLLDAGTPLDGAPSQVGADGSVPITSLTIPNGVGDGNHTVRVVGANGSEATLQITVDNTGPSGGSVDANGLVGTGGRYATQTALQIGFDPGADPADLALTGAQLLRAQAPLSSDGVSDGVCGSFGAFAQVGVLNPISPFANNVPADRTCYRYQYVVGDQLGNKTTYTSPDIKVDATPPPPPTVTFSGTNNAFWPGTGTTIFYKATAANGSFRVTAAGNDNTAGIFRFVFAPLGAGWTSTAAGGNVNEYKWEAANPAAPGGKTVTLTNNASRSSLVTFTPTADVTGPVGGNVAYSDGAINTTTTAVTFSNGNDAGAGVEPGSGLLQRAVANVAGGNCDPFGAFVTVARNPASPFNDNGLEDGKCYQYRYLIADRLDNQTTYTNPNVLRVQLAPTNTSAPTISGTAQEGATLTANNGSWNGSSIVFSHQWRRCDTAGANCADIAGATAPTYQAVSQDVGKTLRVVVTATNGGGSNSATTAQTATVLVAAPTNTAAPTIAGAPQVNQTLTVSEGTWTGNPNFTFQWLRCDTNGNACTNIAVPSTRNYTVEQADVGFTIRVAVTASNAGGTAVATTAPTGVAGSKAPQNTGLPAISGPKIEGQALSTTNGTWTATLGEASLNFSYQWRRCNSAGASCVDIAGATAATYVLQTADVGGTIRVVVTAQDAQGATAATSVQTSVVLFKAPVNNTLPTITGTPEVGKVLTATNGTWTGGGISFAIQWRSCDGNGNNCNSIAGATGPTFTPTETEGERTIRVNVTATNSGGSVVATSTQTARINRATPVNTVAPEVTGNAREGQTLTTTTGTWTGGGINFAFHWLRCNTAGASCTRIVGANAERVTYVPVAADVGSTLRSEVTANNLGHSVNATSAQTSVVTIAAPANTALPTIPGTPREGVRVNASTGTWTGSGITFSFQWLRCDAAGNECGPIAGATEQGYTPVASDANNTLRIVVTATNTGGVASATSAASQVVLFAVPVNLTVPTVSGTPKVGQTLTASDGTWTGTVIEFRYRWRSCGGSGTGCVDIEGAAAANKTYVLTAADLNRRLRVVVTAVNSGGSASKESDPATATVVP
ncbi:MAG TPA: hypothetical protein VMS60_16000 [Solirubrobacterales bacterium]|nr:hypothetical protein [Solirubrobacterales bacterium]